MTREDYIDALFLNECDVAKKNLMNRQPVSPIENCKSLDGSVKVFYLFLLVNY